MCRSAGLVVTLMTLAALVAVAPPAAAAPTAAVRSQVVLTAKNVQLIAPAGQPASRRIALVNTSTTPTPVLDVVDPPTRQGVAVTDECDGLRLAPGASCAVILTRVPVGVGEGPSFRHDLLVNGVSYSVRVTNGYGRGIRPDTDSFDLGYLAVGQRASRTVTWTNDSDLTQVMATRPEPPDGMTVASDCPESGLAPGSACHDTYTARGSSDVIGGDAYLLYFWNGVQSPIEVTFHTVPQVLVSPVFLRFGTVRVGEVSEPQDITVSNLTDAPIRFRPGNPISPLGPQFGIEHDCRGTLVPAHGDCVMTVRFHPVDLGESFVQLMQGVWNGTLLDVDATGVPSSTRPTGPPLELRSADLDFGLLRLGEARTQPAYLHNRSANPLVLDGGATPPASAPITIGGTCSSGVTLQPDDSCRIDVTITGAGTETFSDGYTVGTSWNGQSLPIRAAARVRPALRVAWSSGSALPAAAGRPPATFLLVNDAAEALTIGPPPATPPLLFSGTCVGSTLAPGGSCRLLARLPAGAPYAAVGPRVPWVSASNTPGNLFVFMVVNRYAELESALYADLGRTAVGKVATGYLQAANVTAATIPSALVRFPSLPPGVRVVANGCSGGSVPPGGTCPIEVEVTETSAAALTLQLTGVTGSGTPITFGLTGSAG